MKKILNTRNYRLFERHSGENRQLDIKKHKALMESMKKYGFLEVFPIVVHRNGGDQLIVKDGQHRLAIAETLGLTIYYVEDETDFDVAAVNCTIIRWQLRDFAEKYKENGVKSYEEGLEFADEHKLPIGVSFALLSGVTSFNNISEQFASGRFKVKDRAWAETVASIYGPLVAMSRAVRNIKCLEACMAVSRVADFDPKRLLRSADRCREKLVSYSRRDDYLDMLEDIYNHHRAQLVPLKINAITAMRERNAANQKKAEAAAKRQNGK